jgi:hypothetical protein
MRTFAATQQEIKNAAKDPSRIAGLMAGKSAAEATQIVSDVMKEAIASGGTTNEIRTAVALISAAAMAAASSAGDIQVAQALITTAGPDYIAVTVSAIRLAVGTADNAAAIVSSSIRAAGTANFTVANEAAKDPVVTLGESLAGAVVKFVTTITQGGLSTDGHDFAPPPTAKIYEGQ